MPSLDFVVIKAGIVAAIVNFWWQFVGAIALLLLLGYGLCRFCIYIKRQQPRVVQSVGTVIHQKTCHVPPPASCRRFVDRLFRRRPSSNDSPITLQGVATGNPASR